MALRAPFKLEKLKIRAYLDAERTSQLGVFEAMFNPESYQLDYPVKYSRRQGINTTGPTGTYIHSGPSSLSVKLLLDGSGVSSHGLLRPVQKSVAQRIDEFLELTYRMNGDTHEPPYLLVEWGSRLRFSCRLEQLKISHTGFTRGGDPLSAELEATFRGQLDSELRAARERKSSPDVSHTRLVKAGDTLPLLTEEVYGSAEHYLDVARANGLDDFRHLETGRELVFPPLETK